MAWSLVDRTDPTRPLQVTCTLVVRWWASSLRRSPPGCAGCPAELQSGASRPRPSRLDPDHHTQHTRLGAPKEKAPHRPQEHTRHHLDEPQCTRRRLNHHEDDHQPKDTQSSDLASCAPLYPPVPTPRSSLFIAPPLLPAPAGSFQKRGVPSPPLPARLAGAERIILGTGPGRFIPPKSGPHPT